MLRKWTIHYYNSSVKEEARTLPRAIKAKFEAILDKMLEHGPSWGSLLRELWEMDCLRSGRKGKKAMLEGCFARFPMIR